VQRNLEHERNVLLKSLKEAANDSQAGQDPDKTLAQIDTMTTRLRGLKRKMEAAHEEEKRLTEQTLKRIQHLQDLFEIHSLVDVKYDEWSRIRLDRLLVDYLLRMGYTESATVLAKEKGIEDLVDLDTFIQCHRVEESLRRGSTAEALAWCVDHKPLMKKMGSDLEFELRFQQYIDLRRVDKVAEARAHAMKHLAPHMETYPEQVHQAAGLLAFPPNTKADPYKVRACCNRFSGNSNQTCRCFTRRSVSTSLRISS
jgi:macrophage erythroblast attacher